MGRSVLFQRVGRDHFRFPSPSRLWQEGYGGDGTTFFEKNPPPDGEKSGMSGNEWKWLWGRWARNAEEML